MDVSIVIPTWRGRDLLQAYLPSVVAAAQHYRGETAHEVEIVVVDDAGGDETASWIRDAYGDCVTFLQHPRNLGFAGACRTGFEAARFGLVLLLNNDVRLRDACIAPMVEHFSDRAVFAVTGKMYNQGEDTFCNGGKVARFRRGMWSTYENYDVRPDAAPDLSLLSFTAVGAFSMYDRARFLQLGGFDPLAAMVEDVELSYRAWKRGWAVKYEPRSVAYHDASRTMDRLYKRRHLDRLSRRNWILMHWMLLHDPRMFAAHLCAIGARFLSSWLILDWRFYWAIFTGLAHLPEISRKRRQARMSMAVSDRELLQTLDRFYRSAPIALRRE